MNLMIFICDQCDKITRRPYRNNSSRNSINIVLVIKLYEGIQTCDQCEQYIRLIENKKQCVQGEPPFWNFFQKG